MQHPGFYERSGPFALSAIAGRTRAEIAAPDADADAPFVDIRPLDVAEAHDVSFIDNKKYLGQLATTRAGACFVSPALRDRLPDAVVPLVVERPYHAFAEALFLFYPQAGRPLVYGAPGDDPPGNGAVTSLVHSSAQIEDGAIIEPGAIVGREARIGRGTVIAAGAVIGYRVCIGRDGFVGPGASVIHALVGNRVIIHGGVRIGQDGFGFAMGPDGHRKVPQIGRVIIQDDVEIGACSTIDRGALSDTIIGEGTKIDNLVQIAHNVVVGRHCVIVAQAGVAGSTELGDYVVMGGQAAIAGHLQIGTGAQVAGGAKVKDDIEPGGRYGGYPARPSKQWARELAALARLAAPRRKRD